MRRFLVSGFLVAAVLAAGAARAQEVTPPSKATTAEDAQPILNAPAPAPAAFVDNEKTPPPPTNVVYLQYGVAFTAEAIRDPGKICDNAGLPCILGAGGGVAIRTGWRSTGALYLGGAYEVSKQDPNKLFRLALLQQARFESRWYFSNGRDTEPYISGGAGVAGYGNEWGISTYGPAGFVGGGIEVQLSRRTVVGVALAYRLLWFKSFTDTTGAPREAGLAQLIGLDFVLEQRDPIVRGGRPADRL